MLSLPRRSTFTAGIEFRSDGFCLVQLKRTRQRVELVHASFNPWPTAIFSDGKLKQGDELVSILTEQIPRTHLKPGPIIFSYPASLVHTNHLELPEGLSESQIEAEIRLKIKRDLPGMHEALQIDFTELPFKNTGYTHYFFAAAREDYLLHCIQSLTLAGFQLKVVDVDYYALIRAMSFARRWEPQRNHIYSMVRLLKNQITLLIFDADKILFHEQIELADGIDILVQRLEIYLSMVHGHVDQFIVCGSTADFDVLQQKIILSSTTFIHCPLPFPEIEVELLVAFGAALRAVPVW